MEDTILIDNDVLISLVEARPVLWDKTLDTFKDRNATRDAWRLVCCALKEDFDEMEVKEKNEFGKAVTKRWGNLRDAFSKSMRKMKECKRSGSATSNIKKYVYNDQMKFLNKLYQCREVADSLKKTGGIIADGGDSDEQPQLLVEQETEGLQPPTGDKSCKNNTGNRSNKRRRPDEIEIKMLKALEQPTPSAHMSFFQGIAPHLDKFDSSEVLEFQMDVLQAISKIHNKKKNTGQPLPPQTPPNYQNYTYTQPSSFSHPQTSYSNQWNPNSSQTPFPQTYQFHNPQNFKHPNTKNQQTHPSQTLTSENQQEQTTAQFYQQFGHSSAATSPVNYPSQSPSPSSSACTDTTYDFS